MATTKAPNLGLQNAQKSWFNAYSNKIRTGTNNTADLNRYNDYARILKLQKTNVSTPALHQLSIKALSGDTNAQNYLKAMNLKSQTGADLWSGVNPSTLKQGSSLWTQYMKDNPYSNTAKAYDQNTYNTYGNMITNGQSLNDGQMTSYMNAVNKWNLQDDNSPFVQQQKQLAKDKTTALRAEDKSLNQTLTTSDATNFQAMQTLQQQMADKGMGASGIAADAYARATMANNQNYQQAFADSATKKADLTKSYDDSISQSKLDQQTYLDDRADAEAKAQSDAASAQAELANAQTEQDKYLTSSTGYVYLNGQMLKYNGQPLTSLDYQKMTETQRHNLATENNTAFANQINAQKVSNDYALGMDANDIKRQQIAADIQIQTSKMQLDYAKLDYNYAKLDSDNAIAQDKINVAKENAQTSADKGKITSLGKQLSSLTSQITAYQKKGKKPPKDLVTKYNNVLNSLNDVSSNFKYSSEGSGGQQAINVGKGLIGKTKYVWGGGRTASDIAKGNFDCSGFVNYAFKQAGIDLGSGNTDTIAKKGVAVNASQMQPGDIVFFDTYKKNGHVGIYVGNGKFIGAQSKTGVAIADMSSGYFKEHFHGVVRRVSGGSSAVSSSSSDSSYNYGNGSYNNYRKVGQQPAAFNSQLNLAVKKGYVPSSEAKALTELIGRESSWRPTAKNPHSTATGYGQFLKGTIAEYKKKYPNLDYSNPTDQIILTYKYAVNRYGSVAKALKFWDAHNWY